MEGPFIGYKKVQVPLLLDLHIAAALLDPYRTPCDDHPAWDNYMTVFRRHMDKYFQGVDLGMDNRATWRFTERMIHLYLEARSIWAERGILRSQSRPSAQEQAHANKVANVSAISLWRTGALPIPQDKEGKEARKELCEISQRTLAVSPTATVTERSFRHEKRIHSLQRAILLPDGVRKMLFCQWNCRVLRDGADKNEADLRRQLRKTAEPIQKLRSVRANITESHVSRSAAAISATRSDTNSIMPRSSHPSEDLPRNGATSSSPTTSRDDEGNRVLVSEMIPQSSVQPSTGLGNLRNRYNSPSHVGDINQTGRGVGRTLHAEVAEDVVRHGIDNGDGIEASADVGVPETETGNRG